MLLHLIILNYNGRHLLAECLPSVVAAARASRHRCEVIVIDNDSADDSVVWLEEHYPEVRVVRRPNRGLTSYNEVVAGLPGPVAVLLNNDIKLDEHCLDPLVEPLLAPGDCFMTAPMCRRFDDTTYEGFRTAVDWRWGLVCATALYPGHEAAIDRPGWTAAAGAAMAVDRAKFVAMGGFDPLYLPGRLEDLDFAFRAYQAGYHAQYVPEALAWHRGMATFAAVFGREGCDRLALRNTLLFQWKNLRHPRHVARQLICLPIRLAADVLRAPLVGPGRRWAFVRAMVGALTRLGRLRAEAYRPRRNLRRERDFFRRFAPSRARRSTDDTTANVAMATGSLSETTITEARATP
jgi:GT2 family glycosyltransferase